MDGRLDDGHTCLPPRSAIVPSARIETAKTSLYMVIDLLTERDLSVHLIKRLGRQIRCHKSHEQ
ncbi:hypothetical protein AGR6A_pTi0077 [Agrobacterium sp. NCPPB 925]|nr:hypothetical protein AGR6A_pTi0077 [Agrobacterium sp. NCPPB 925]